MSDRTFEIVKLLLDKALLVLVGGVVTYWFSRASDRKRDRLAWARAKAEQRLSTYREISSILGPQLVGITRFSNVIEAVNTHPDSVDPMKAQQFATRLFNDLAARHFQNASSLLAAAPFVGRRVGGPLTAYQKAVGRFSRIVESSYGDGAQPVSLTEIRSMMKDLVPAWNDLQLAIRDEFDSHPLDDEAPGTQPTGKAKPADDSNSNATS